jgi:hypothetical protein
VVQHFGHTHFASGANALNVNAAMLMHYLVVQTAVHNAVFFSPTAKIATVKLRTMHCSPVRPIVGTGRNALVPKPLDAATHEEWLNGAGRHWIFFGRRKQIRHIHWTRVWV